MNWNLNGVENIDEYFNVRYFENKKPVIIAYRFTNSQNITGELTYYRQDNPFEPNRISTSVNLVNGNGTVTFGLKNIKYDESGVYMFQMFKTEQLDIFVEVQGKKNTLGI